MAEELQRQLPNAKADVEKAQAELACTTQKATEAATRASASGETPMHATIGGLGFDLTEQEALKRATQVLDKVAVKKGEWYDEMWAERDNKVSSVKAVSNAKD